MTKHTMDLLENAIDSLGEALTKYEEGENGNEKAYKFDILHLSHFIELIFKYYIADKHKLLIYKNPFAEKIEENKTIGFWDAVNFISNESGEIAKNSDFRRDLTWLKKIRNDIEHYKFEMNLDETREVLGRIFRSLLEFLEVTGTLEIDMLIPKELTETFSELADEYTGKLKRAERAVEKAKEDAYSGIRSQDEDMLEWEILNCEECSNPLMIPDETSGTGYKCQLCGNEESFEIKASCSNCGDTDYADDMSTWTDDNGNTELRCYYCSGRYHFDKDD